MADNPSVNQIADTKIGEAASVGRKVDLSRFVSQRIRGINDSVVLRSDERWNSTARLFRGDKNLVASRGPITRYSMAAALAYVGEEKEKGKKINSKLR